MAVCPFRPVVESKHGARSKDVKDARAREKSVLSVLVVLGECLRRCKVLKLFNLLVRICAHILGTHLWQCPYPPTGFAKTLFCGPNAELASRPASRCRTKADVPHSLLDHPCRT